MTEASVDSLYELTEKDSHKSLYLAVIIQALLDMTKPEVEGEDNEIRIQRDQAHAWFFASVGVTCDDFEAVCHYARPDIFELNINERSNSSVTSQKIKKNIVKK